MNKAILVVSFGTTHLDTLEKTICAVERDIQNANPGVPCYRAFTSNTIRKRLASQAGLTVDSVAEAFARMAADGITQVELKPTLLLPGEEYDKLRADAISAAGDMVVSIGLPLLWDDLSIQKMVAILKEAYPMPEDTILLAMGHGTSHTADVMYKRLRKAMNEAGMELCTVEGAIDFEAAKEALLAQDKRKVHLIPLLLVAGDHSKNDMAGDEPDSLKSILTEAGFEVSFSLKGLGEIEGIRKMY